MFQFNFNVCILSSGAFSRFLPTLPYPFVGGDNSPPISTHSPPAAIAMTNIGNGNRISLSGRDARDSIDYLNTPTLVRPQPQLPSSAASIVAGGHLPNGTPSTLSPLRIRVSSPNRINSDLTSVSVLFRTVCWHFFVCLIRILFRSINIIGKKIKAIWTNFNVITIWLKSSFFCVIWYRV